MIKLIIIVIYSAIIAFGQYLFKHSADLINTKSQLFGVKELVLSPNFLLAIFTYLFASVFWVYILNKFSLSNAYPIAVSCSLVLTGAVGVIIFREAFTLKLALGYLLVILAFIFLTI